MRSIGERIKELRKTLGVTQTEMAKRLLLERGSMCDIERGKVKKVTERVIKSICQEFNVNEAWLKTGEGETFKSDSELFESLSPLISTLTELEKRFLLNYVKLPQKHRILAFQFVEKLFSDNNKKV